MENNALNNLQQLQKLSDSFALFSDSSRGIWLTSKDYDLAIRIKKNGYVPKSGLLIAEALKDVSISGKKVLDIGTGETGFLAYYLNARGASEVVGCDIDQSALEWASQAGDYKNIQWILSDVFQSINDSLMFDIVVSNPPQMPMPRSGDHHDYGGGDGRDVILEIINGCSKHLNPGGQLFLLCFDFLGVLESYNSKPSISELASKKGFGCSVTMRRNQTVRQGGQTEKNIDWIKVVYPRYQFKKNVAGLLVHEVFVVELKRLNAAGRDEQQT